MSTWQKIPILLLMVFIDTLITTTVASSLMLLLISAEYEKHVCLGIAIAAAIFTMLYLRFNHLLRNQLKGDLT